MAASGKKKRKVFFTVECNEHGRESVANREKEVRVLPPASKAHSRSGCPICRLKRGA